MQYTDTIKKKLLEISEHDFRKVIFASTIFAFIMLASYGYLVAATVSNLVAYSSAKASITEINSELSGLESKYMALSRSLTEEKALQMGLVLNQGSHFIVLNPKTGTALAEALTDVR